MAVKSEAMTRKANARNQAARTTAPGTAAASGTVAASGTAAASARAAARMRAAADTARAV